MNLASIGLLGYGVGALWLLFALITLVVLLRLYTQTRMSGFLWLLFALVVWPSLARGVNMMLPVYAARQAMPTESMVLVSLGVSALETVVGGALLLISLMVLLRELTQRGVTGQTNAPPVPDMPRF